MKKRRSENADDTKQIEDHTKQNKRRQSSWDPNSVGLGLGYFERAKLSHSCWIESFVGQLRSLVNSVRWSSENPTTHPLACIKVAVAGERAQFSYYVVFSAVVALRCSRGWVPARTASSGMLLGKPFLSSIVVEAHKEVVCFLTQRYIRYPHAWNEGDFEIAMGIPEFEQLKILLIRTCKRLESVKRSQCEPAVSATDPNRDISLKQRRCSVIKVPLNGVDLAQLVKRVAIMKTELRRVFNL
ncbi:hypothetical protein T08_13376 [Trichinella sp. T8]|nr:hypothetical protein T08_13376 [Trichinella sp. T8]